MSCSKTYLTLLKPEFPALQKTKNRHTKKTQKTKQESVPPFFKMIYISAPFQRTLVSSEEVQIPKLGIQGAHQPCPFLPRLVMYHISLPLEPSTFKWNYPHFSEMTCAFLSPCRILAGKFSPVHQLYLPSLYFPATYILELNQCFRNHCPQQSIIRPHACTQLPYPANLGSSRDSMVN